MHSLIWYRTVITVSQLNTEECTTNNMIITITILTLILGLQLLCIIIGGIRIIQWCQFSIITRIILRTSILAESRLTISSIITNNRETRRNLYTIIDISPFTGNPFNMNLMLKILTNTNIMNLRDITILNKIFWKNILNIHTNMIAISLIPLDCNFLVVIYCG